MKRVKREERKKEDWEGEEKLKRKKESERGGGVQKQMDL
jgi:hypothetical protein